MGSESRKRIRIQSAYGPKNATDGTQLSRSCTFPVSDVAVRALRGEHSVSAVCCVSKKYVFCASSGRFRNRKKKKDLKILVWVSTPQSLF